jgi:hypothetical protein
MSIAMNALFKQVSPIPLYLRVATFICGTLFFAGSWALSPPVPPRTLPEKVKNANLIVVGIVKIANCEIFPYAGNPPLLSGKSRIGTPEECSKMPVAPVPRFDIQIKEVLCDRTRKMTAGNHLTTTAAIQFKDWNLEVKRYVGKELVYFLGTDDPTTTPQTWGWLEPAQDIESDAQIRAAIRADKCDAAK